MRNNRQRKTSISYKANTDRKMQQNKFEYQLKKALEEGTEKSNKIKNKCKKAGNFNKQGWNYDRDKL